MKNIYQTLCYNLGIASDGINAIVTHFIPQSHLLYGGRTVAVELQNRVIPAVAVEILRWPQGNRTANPYVLQAAGVAVEL